MSAYFDSHLNLYCRRLSGLHSIGFDFAGARVCVRLSLGSLWLSKSIRTDVDMEDEKIKIKRRIKYVRTANRRRRKEKKNATTKNERAKIVCRYTLVFVLNRTTIRPY